MTKLVLIHTVTPVLKSFPKLIKESIGDIEIINVLDEFLAIDVNRRKQFTANNMRRLYALVENAQNTGADLVMSTCSTLSPHIDLIQPFMNTPILKMDEGMIREAVYLGENILLMATAVSTIEPSKQQLFKVASELGKKVTVDVLHSQDAFIALNSNDRKKHDEILLELASKINHYDVVLLAQASMAHLDHKIREICGCPVLSSPNFAINLLKEKIDRLNKKEKAKCI